MHASRLHPVGPAESTLHLNGLDRSIQTEAPDMILCKLLREPHGERLHTFLYVALSGRISATKETFHTHM